MGVVGRDCICANSTSFDSDEELSVTTAIIGLVSLILWAWKLIGLGCFSSGLCAGAIKIFVVLGFSIFFPNVFKILQADSANHQYHWLHLHLLPLHLPSSLKCVASSP